MKYVVFILLLFCLNANSQVYPPPIKSPAAWEFGKFDSSFAPPYGDTARKKLVNRVGFIKFHTDKLPYYWDSLKWVAFGTGSGGSSTNIGNTNLRLTGNRRLSGGAGASNGHSFTFDSLASLNLTRKSNGIDYFYIGQDGNMILNNDVGEVLNIGSDGAFNLSNKNDAFDANISRVELSAGSDTVTFAFKNRTKVQLEKVNPNNGSAYKILVRNEGSKEVEYVDAVNVDTTVLATKAYVNYKDDIQQGFIDLRKLESDSSASDGYTRRDRLQQQLDSARTAQQGLIRDSLNSFNRLRAGTSAGGVFQTNTGATSFSYGAGGSTEVTFNGFAGYNANRASSYTTRSFTDKNYVDSSNALKVNKSGDVITGRLTSQSLLLNKDSVPITTSNLWALYLDSTTNRVQRKLEFVPFPDTTVTASYTLTTRDIGRIVTVNSASNVNITVPTGLTSNLGEKFKIGVIQSNAGVVTFVASGTTINSFNAWLRTGGQHAFAAVMPTATNTFLLYGNIMP